MDEVVKIFLIITLPLLVVFIGILVSFIITYLKTGSQFSKILTPVAKIEEHARRIPNIEDKIAELRLAIEKGAVGRSVHMELKKCAISPLVSFRDRKPDSVTVKIEFDNPIVPESVTEAVRSYISGEPFRSGIKSFALSLYSIDLEIRETDPQVAASSVKVFLAYLDEELYKEKNWESIFESKLKEE